MCPRLHAVIAVITVVIIAPASASACACLLLLLLLLLLPLLLLLTSLLLLLVRLLVCAAIGVKRNELDRTSRHDTVRHRSSSYGRGGLGRDPKSGGHERIPVRAAPARPRQAGTISGGSSSSSRLGQPRGDLRANGKWSDTVSMMVMVVWCSGHVRMYSRSRAKCVLPFGCAVSKRRGRSVLAAAVSQGSA